MFKRVFIEISNICNLSCSFCPEVLREKSVMGPTLFQTILKEVVPLTEQVCLHLMGEPMTHPEFQKILEICDQEKAKIYLTTNGLLLKKWRQSLLDQQHLDQINFSLHSFRDNFPGRPLLPYLNEIFEFSSEMAKQRPEVYINFRLWNQQETDQINNSNDEIISAIQKYFKMEINSNINLSWKKNKRIQDRTYLHFDSEFEWPNIKGEIQSEQGFCHALSTHIGILSDGSVVPCCLDKDGIIKLGSCEKGSLKKILESERAKQMREGFKKRILVEDLCKRCSYIGRFK